MHIVASSRISIFWFRRDLRLEDNVGFSKALQAGLPVLPIFIFDTTILDRLPKKDARVTFIYEQLQDLHKVLEDNVQSGIARYYGTPETVFERLSQEFEIAAVYTNHDYEPNAIARDTRVMSMLSRKRIAYYSYKDQVIFEKNEITKDDGNPYVVYTPYKRKWMATFKAATDVQAYDTHPYFDTLVTGISFPAPTLAAMGFEMATIKVPPYTATSHLIQQYEATRNYPAIKNGTSRLGPHLRFGTVSIRKMVQKAIAEENTVFWSELIWREFFMQILWHFPHTTHKAFKPKYDRILWRNNEAEFKKWCDGQTGYPFVDAGMRELNTTGFMHNRVRMLVASFLCKHLLIDWRWGEAYFAEKLLDYDQSANVGNWQWAAGSGVDAAPYFRIFNPITQIDKFDAQKAYIHQWVPDLQELSYPPMMVDHKLARERCLKVYKEAVG